jgi:hypothetical protein
MLNLMVAIMGDTFNRVKADEDKSKLKEITGMMVENELLMDRKKTFKDAKYIIVITQESVEYDEENWDGTIKQMQRAIKH